MRNKVFCIIISVLYFIFPILFFFNIFEHKEKRINDANELCTLIHKYSIINIKELHTFYLVIGIMFMVISLTLAVFAILEIRKEKY